jgi:HAE1 family hydrophobic/amphiphilic exporter-1
MNFVDLSIKRPAFITSIMVIFIVAGIICFKLMSVDLYPDVTIPTISINIAYSGAGPSEIENLISKPVEEQISTIAGLKSVSSRSSRGISNITVNFNQGVDIRYGEQQVRDKINQIRRSLPDDIEDPVIIRFDPSQQPIMSIVVTSDLSESKLYDIVEQYIKPSFEQVENVGMVEISGGRKRQINITLDQDLLKKRQISVSQVAKQLQELGDNTPIGKIDYQNVETIFQNYGEFSNIAEISGVIVNFYNNESPTRITDLATIEDGLQDEVSRAFFNGKKSLFIDVFRQPSSNIVAVADKLTLQLSKLEKDFAKMEGNIKAKIIQNQSDHIKHNIADVYETITIAIILTLITVFFFLANLRATLITAISLPICLIGAFIAMYIAGFSINVISLMALSLAVGLLVDDAIVVTENIYRKIEAGNNPIQAASIGAKEIILAVVAISLVMISVFVPTAFMKGIVGQFLKQFGLTISFAILISLFVAITIVPVLCAYFSRQEALIAKNSQQKISIIQKLLTKFNFFQNWLEIKYEKILIFSIKKPLIILLITFIIVVLSFFAFINVPKSFIDNADTGDINLSIELEADANLEATTKIATAMDQAIRSNLEVLETIVQIASGTASQSNKGKIYIKLKDIKERKITTEQFEEKLREQMKDFAAANPIIGSYNQPFSLILSSNNQELLEKYSKELIQKLENDQHYKDVNSNLKNNRNEYRVKIKEDAAQIYGINSDMIGKELKGYVEGYTPTKFREKGLEYDVRIRIKEEQRNIKKNFDSLYVPNINNKLIKLSDIAYGQEVKEPSTIYRQDRGRYVRITSNLAPGFGLSNAISNLATLFESSELKLPAEIKYKFSGEVENMNDMFESLGPIFIIAILFIYLILASLYESFITPFTILLSLPLALCGAILGLFIAHKYFNLHAILGIFMLLGVAGKNAILLVDFAIKAIAEGKSRSEALISAGRTRLRPILMTSFALILGTIPIAIGISESSKSRTSMGIAIIGGMILSTILTLVVVPAVFSYIDRFRVWIKKRLAFLINHE